MTLLAMARPAFSQVDSPRDQCSFELVTAAMARDAVVADLIALDQRIVTSVSDLSTRVDSKSTGLQRVHGQRPTRRTENRTLGILRGYARALARRNQSIYYSGELFWTEPAVGVIFNTASGRARETLAVDVSPDMGEIKIPLERSAERLLDHSLTERLFGAGIAQHQVAPPAWAELYYDRMAEAHLLRYVADYARMPIHRRHFDLAEIRRNENYQTSLERMVHHKNLSPAPTARGRLIFDMASYGYGLEWKDSIELHDILADLMGKLDRYQLVLYWDPGNFIELIDGKIRRY